MISVANLLLVLLLFALFLGFIVLVVLLRRMRHEIFVMKQAAVLHDKEKNATTGTDSIELRKILLPVQLGAYERLILFLERIQPQVIMKRNYEPTLDLKQFQLRLLQNIRDEFEHNLAQQLYVSEAAWQLIKTAREELVQQINLLAASVEDGKDAASLASSLAALQSPLIEQSIQKLKQEFRLLSAGK